MSETTASAQRTIRPRRAVFVAAFAAFLATFNETYLNIAFTPIMEELGVSITTVQWLATAYMLGAAVMVPVSAFLYRKVPTRRLFVITVAFLVVGSVIGALAGSFPILLTGRIVQAIGTGMLIPIGMNITLDVAPREKLGSYMGIMGAMTTLGPSLSVILAGVLLSAFNWHVLLWVFAGLSLLCLLSGAFFLGDIAKLTNPRLDIASVAMIGVSLVCLLYGISTLFSGSRITAVIAILAGAVMMYLFIRRQGTLNDPLLNLKPLTVMPFVLGVLANMLSLIVIFAMNIILPIFMQSTLGTSSFAASLTLFPAIMLSCVVSPVAGRIYDQQGAKNLLPAGFSAIVVFTFLIGLLGRQISLPVLALLYIPVICGSALIIGPVQSFALSRLTPALNPHGVTVMSTGFQIAGCIGSSIFTGVYSVSLAGRMAGGADADTASSGAFMTTCFLASICALIGVGIALKIRSISLKSQPAVPWDHQKEDKFAAGFSNDPLRTLMKKEVYTISGQASVLDALHLITEKKVSGVPVTDRSGQPVSFISDGDILRYLSNESPLFSNIYAVGARNADKSFEERIHELMEMKVSDLARSKIITVDVNDRFEDICRILFANHLKKVPVMENGQMIGIINNSNITKYALKNYLETITQND